LKEKGEMKMACHRIVRLVVLAWLVGAVSGCYYPISQQLRQEARKDLTFPEVLRDPAAYTGSIVLWGGSIIETVPLSAGSEILVLQTPLDYTEMPESTQYSQGRFIAKSPVFLDPEIYRRGRKVTLAGEIIGKETRPLGKSEYTYPVVAIKQVHLWERRRTYVRPYPYYDWYWGPGWGWRWGWYGPGPYWDDWYEVDED